MFPRIKREDTVRQVKIIENNLIERPSLIVTRSKSSRTIISDRRAKSGDEELIMDFLKRMHH